MAALVKLLTGSMTARPGRPSSVVATATTKGRLFSEPRPGLPPLRSPPRLGVVDLHQVTQLPRGFPCAHSLHQLVFHPPSGAIAHAQAARQL